MHLYMITMAVAAVGLVAEQQICVFIAEYLGESLRGLIDLRSPEPDPSGGSG
jgi:hypothetical protein